MKEASINFMDHRLKDLCFYPTPTFNMFWLGKKDEAGSYIRLSSVHQCREVFASYLRRMFPNDGRTKRGMTNIWQFEDRFSRQCRFCIVHKLPSNGSQLSEENEEELTAKVKSARRIVNLVSKKMGWGPTTIYKVKREGDAVDPFARAYIVNGPGKWSHSIQGLSLYLLLLRFGFTSSYHLKPIRNFDALIGYLTDGNKPCLPYMAELSHYLPKIVENADKIFLAGTQRGNFRGNTSMHGISDLIRNTRKRLTPPEVAWREITKG